MSGSICTSSKRKFLMSTAILSKTVATCGY